MEGARAGNRVSRPDFCSSARAPNRFRDHFPDHYFGNPIYQNDRREIKFQLVKRIKPIRLTRVKTALKVGELIPAQAYDRDEYI